MVIHAPTTNRSNSSERTYKAYTLLLRLVPRLKEMLEDSSIETDVFDGFIAQVRCIPDVASVFLIYAAASKGRQRCTQ
jgi:ABC-type arginine transport system permease subunit